MLMPILIYVISMVILYIVIETAVRNGINSSVLGKRFDNEDKKSWLDDDLDN
ncbi:hypothetical protein [Bacillus solimangrovi]|uniref:hypothetical protein n=1 Tax=Bacillus solimangrovi TaxID=1305675 RepID=UPI000B1C4FB5|nr:hypothetical protein [Bacillus solimangrovi]